MKLQLIVVMNFKARKRWCYYFCANSSYWFTTLPPNHDHRVYYGLEFLEVFFCLFFFNLSEDEKVSHCPKYSFLDRKIVWYKSALDWELLKTCLVATLLFFTLRYSKDAFPRGDVCTYFCFTTQLAHGSKCMFYIQEPPGTRSRCFSCSVLPIGHVRTLMCPDYNNIFLSR